MGKAHPPILAFNRGKVSQLALARTDIERARISAAVMKNWVPRVLGPMMVRPGTADIGGTASNNQARTLPFIFSVNDCALIEATDSLLRFWVNDALVIRVSVTAAFTNGTFPSNLTGWTGADEAAATSSWVAGAMRLVGSGFTRAIRYQKLTLGGSDSGKVHAIRFTVTAAPLLFQVGTTAGGTELLAETELGIGTHSIVVLPTTDFYVQFANRSTAYSEVDNVSIEAAGALTLPTTWDADDLSMLRIEQSADVVYVACDGQQQQKIERRANGSWSLVAYAPVDGPFRVQNLGQISLTASALTGDATLTASQPLFQATHAGALFKLVSAGQSTTVTLTGDLQYGAPIRVAGVGAARAFVLTATGTWTGNLKLQRSVGAIGAWEDNATYTGSGVANLNDLLDNQIIYYRVGFNTGDYASGTATVVLSYPNGTIIGIARIIAIDSPTDADVNVLQAFGSTTATMNWSEGAWSDYRGWPSAVSFHEGRLWWAGKDKIWGSISDEYEGFDEDFIGDAGPISRSVAINPVQTVNWLLSGQRLLLGAQMAEINARSSDIGEPLTPTNFNLLAVSRQGSAAISGVLLDVDVVFVQRNGTRVFRMSYSRYNADGREYTPTDLTALIPEMCEPGAVIMAVQRKPDTRVHIVKSDGTVAILIFDATENVQAWVDYITSGTVEDVVVLPGGVEDAVYYLVNRGTANAPIRRLEKWALESESVGGTITKCVDAHVVYSGAPTTTLTGFTHLVGKTVAIWGDGKDQGTAVVDGSGHVTVGVAVSNACAGLPYNADWQSMKLAYAAQMGTALTQRKQVDAIGLILRNAHYQGIKYGPDFDNLDNLPLVEAGKTTAADTVWENYDEDMFTFEGSWSTDSRVCLRGASPRPCTVLGMVSSIWTNER